MLNGGADGGSLNGHGFRANGIEKQLDRGQVEGQWSLHVGIACKDHESSTVAIQTANDALNGALGKIEPRHPQVFRHH